MLLTAFKCSMAIWLPAKGRVYVKTFTTLACSWLGVLYLSAAYLFDSSLLLRCTRWSPCPVGVSVVDSCASAKFSTGMFQNWFLVLQCCTRSSHLQDNSVVLSNGVTQGYARFFSRHAGPQIEIWGRATELIWGGGGGGT